MKQFYQSTYYFWTISKFIFAIAGIVSAIELLGINDLMFYERLANFVAIAYCFCLILDIIFSINRNHYKFLKIMNGTISIFLSLAIFVLVVTVKVISIPLALLFILWIFLLGLFDLLQIKRSDE